MRISNGTSVLVCDGTKYLLLENIGDEDIMDLRVVSHDEIDNPMTSEQGTDRPGRAHMLGDRRLTFQETDWHKLTEQSFARDIADKVEAWMAKGKISKLVIAADPRTLGTLRKVLPDKVRQGVIAEVHGDYVGKPVNMLESILAKA